VARARSFEVIISPGETIARPPRERHNFLLSSENLFSLTNERSNKLTNEQQRRAAHYQTLRIIFPGTVRLLLSEIHAIIMCGFYCSTHLSLLRNPHHKHLKLLAKYKFTKYTIVVFLLEKPSYAYYGLQSACATANYPQPTFQALIYT
jgi:hypothetical protein